MDADENGVGRAIGYGEPRRKIKLFLATLIICIPIVQEAIVLACHDHVHAVGAEHIAKHLGNFKIYVLFYKTRGA